MDRRLSSSWRATWAEFKDPDNALLETLVDVPPPQNAKILEIENKCREEMKKKEETEKKEGSGDGGISKSVLDWVSATADDRFVFKHSRAKLLFVHV